MSRTARAFVVLLILAVVGGGLGYGGVQLGRWMNSSPGKTGEPGPDGSDPTGPPDGSELPSVTDLQAFPEFWQRAIASLGGHERLSKIRSLRIHVLARETGGPQHHATVSYRFPDGYRMDAQVMDAHLVQATDGKECWSTFDEMDVRYDPKDRKLLEEQTLLARLSLLVSLDPEREIDIEMAKVEDDLQRVEVRFLNGDFGPYALGFDPKTALLREATWDTRILLHGAKEGEVRLAMSDYREVEGIRVPFEATYHIGDKARANSKVQKVEINPEFPDGFFSRPKSEVLVPVKERTLEAHPAVILRKGEGRTPEFKKLDKLVAASGLRRNGTRFCIVEDGEVVAVGLGIEAPEKPELPDEVEIVTLPACRALTCAIAEDSEKEWEEAHRRLRARAKERGLSCEGSFHHVIWGAKGPVQIQLLEKSENKGKSGASEDGG